MINAIIADSFQPITNGKVQIRGINQLNKVHITTVDIARPNKNKPTIVRQLKNFSINLLHY